MKNIRFFSGMEYCPIKQYSKQTWRTCSDAAQQVINEVTGGDLELQEYARAYAFYNQISEDLEVLRQKLTAHINKSVEVVRLNELQFHAVASFTVTNFSSGHGVTPAGEKSDTSSQETLAVISARLGRNYDSKKVVSGFHTTYYWH